MQCGFSGFCAGLCRNTVSLTNRKDTGNGHNSCCVLHSSSIGCSHDHHCDYSVAIMPYLRFYAAGRPNTLSHRKSLPAIGAISVGAAHTNVRELCEEWARALTGIEN